MFRWMLKSVSVAAVAAMATVVMAQSSTQLPEVKVVASKAVTKYGRNERGQPVEVFQLSRLVKYSDINIATASGAAVLQQRVADAAKSVCEELGKLYPTTITGTNSCAADAVKIAQPQVQAAIDSAEKGIRSAEVAR
jgi:UrcA family protein